MKKIFKSILCTLGALAVFSCAVDELNAPAPIEVPDGYTLMRFTANADVTKTAIDNGHTVWSEGDQINIFWDNGHSITQASLTGGAGTASGTFEAVVPEDAVITCAIYPIYVEANVEGSNVTLPFRADQEGTFSAGNMAVAKVGEGNVLNFYNVNSFIAVQLTSSDITKIEVESVGGGALVGNLPVNFAGDEPVFGDIESASSSVTMSAGAAGVYYISVLSGVAHDGGLLLKYYKGEEVSGTYMLDKEITTQRSHILQLGEFEPNGEYFVTVEGAGRHTGLSWADAFSNDEMKDLLINVADNPAKAAAADGATYYMAGGTYDFGDNPRLEFNETEAVTLTIKGGYNASTGERNLEANPTIFTGARDDNADPVTGHICLKVRGNMHITLDGLHFENGLTSQDKGGALNCANETLYVTLVDCVIDNNKNKVDGADKNGAGLYIEAVAGFEATRVSITNNTCLHAPALYVYNMPADIPVVFNDCLFEHNYASSWGGLARIRVGSPNCVFNSCTFNENSANGDSGGIVQNDGTMTFNNCTFTKNTSSGNGGAITMNGDGETCIIKGGTFSENAAKLGGAIFTPANTKVNTVTISDNCTFSKNYAISGGWGGAIHFKSAGTLTVTDCTFSENYSTDGDSGAFNADNANATYTFARVNFTGNHADGDHGGVMWISDGTFSFTKCLFKGNYTANSGGVAYIEKTGNYSFSGCEFQGNYAANKDKYGGAVYSVSTNPVVFENCSFSGNHTEKGYGGALALKAESQLTIKGGSFTKNYAKSGGAILVKSNGSLVIEKDEFQGTVFDGNYTVSDGSNGGAIRTESKNGTFSCTSASFINNEIKYDGENAALGGAISISDGQNGVHADIVDCTFTGNKTVGGGGVALSYQSSTGDSNGDGTGYMRVSNCSFTNNVNSYEGTNNDNYARHGGAVRLGHDATPSYFDKCTFIGNGTLTADAEVKSAYGGAITYYADGMSYINNCHFEGNFATRGGAISSWGCTASGLYINGCSFSGNWTSYKYGTTIFVSRTQKFCMNNCSINDDTYNLSSSDDGACWVYLDGDIAANDKSFSNSGTKHLEECVISNCTMIGSARQSSELTPLTNDQELFYLLDLKDGATAYLINNAIVADATGHYSWWFSRANTNGYNNVSKQAGNNSVSSCTYTVSNDTSGKVKSDFGSLAWDSTNKVWGWNGTLNGGYTAISASDFDAALAAGSADFKAWLETTLGVIHKDQLGTDRGSTAWWPGAYQAN